MIRKLFKLVGMATVFSVSSVAVAYPIAMIDEFQKIYLPVGGVDFSVRSSYETETLTGKFLQGCRWDLDLDGEFDDLSCSFDDDPNYDFSGYEYADWDTLQRAGLLEAGRYEVRVMVYNNIDESDIAIGWLTVIDPKAPPPAVVPAPASLATFGLGIGLLAMRNRRRAINSNGAPTLQGSDTLPVYNVKTP